MPKQPSKLTAAILAHLASMSEEEAATFYGVKPTAIRTALRTKKPSMAMAEVYAEQMFNKANAGASSVTGNTATGETGIGFATEDILNHPVIQQIVTKINELTAQGSALVTGHEGATTRLSEIEAVVRGIYHRVQGGTGAAVTPPQPARVPVGTPPPMAQPGDRFLQPEEISTVRPYRPPVTGEVEMPAIFGSAPAARQPVDDGTGSIALKTAFDWLSPHAKR